VQLLISAMPLFVHSLYKRSSLAAWKSRAHRQRVVIWTSPRGGSIEMRRAVSQSAVDVDVHSLRRNGRDDAAARAGRSRVHPRTGLAGPHTANHTLVKRRGTDLVEDHLKALRLQTINCVGRYRAPTATRLRHRQPVPVQRKPLHPRQSCTSLQVLSRCRPSFGAAGRSDGGNTR
jgi:hypothetical protein